MLSLVCCDLVSGMFYEFNTGRVVGEMVVVWVILEILYAYFDWTFLWGFSLIWVFLQIVLSYKHFDFAIINVEIFLWIIFVTVFLFQLFHWLILNFIEGRLISNWLIIYFFSLLQSRKHAVPIVNYLIA